MPLHEIAAAPAAPRLVIATDEDVLEVWDIESRALVSRFESVYYLGGRRLAIDASGTRVAAAAWARHGVACYDAQTGSVVWRSKDLTSNQWLRFSNDGSLLYVGQDRKPLRVLNAATGEDVASLRGVGAMWESPVDDLVVREQRGGKPLSVVRRSTGTVMGKLPGHRWTNAVAFTPGEICVAYPGVYGSEERATVRGFSSTTFEERWSYTSPESRHVLRLAASPDGAGFLGVEFCMSDSDAPDRLLHFSVNTGRTRLVAKSPRSTDWQFVSGGRHLVTSRGRVVDCQTGKVLPPFPFA